MSDIPQDLKYTKEHEWVRVEGDEIVVGITGHAVEQLGDVTMVTLPDPGQAVTAGEAFGDIDSVKAVSELYAPVSGEVTARNEALDDAPELVNDEPYGKGWMVKIRPSDPAELGALLDPAAYAELLAEG